MLFKNYQYLCQKLPNSFFIPLKNGIVSAKMSIFEGYIKCFNS